MRELRFNYGRDPQGQGFFWAASDQKRQEWHAVKRLSPMIAESVYQCRPGARQGVIFTDDDFLGYPAPFGLSLGVGSPTIKQWLRDAGGFVVQSWDTAFSANQDSDFTVCVTALLVPCEHYHRNESIAEMGPCESHYDVYVVDVYRDRIPWAEVSPVARMQYMKWLPSIVVIEKRAYGVPLIENLSKAGIPLEQVNPMDNKRARAVEGVGAGSVQGWFRLHRVRFPMDERWFPEYIREFKDFTGEKGNRDDQVDATINLIQHAIRSGGASVLLPSGWQTPEAVDRQMNPVMTPVGNLPQAMFDTEFDPFDQTCGRCMNYVQTARKESLDLDPKLKNLPYDYCMVHKSRMPILASCYEFTGADSILTLARN
jgi:predicted phage terminase large subunit-like protein